ncbi:DUF7144 family membrane protein [Blastococcus sp. PRF04-17]|uniref:DUF7144 family membrane protein n=1 Tax=Blastococcus sp. PRF04-17 TaxID=2933797 RepID=UPI001FF165BA|nr:hypothetical protein [Blastococcus sp. PRF04-17]UOY00810.1 hypothetical protein MVA48_17770 [Blastococcus sp. PRF04-17]
MTEKAPATQRPPMPTATRVAVVLMALLGVLLLLNSALTWIAQREVVDRLVSSGVDRSEAAQTLLLFGLAYTVIGLTALTAAAFLPRRRAWARRLGVLVTSLLAVVTLLSILAAAAASALSLLLMVCSVAALTSLLTRPTKDWLAGSPAHD